MVPVMLKSKLLSLLLASSALVFAGCVSEPDDEVGSDELAAIESETRDSRAGAAVSGPE
jgi:PBP1b-binding outer membrane lipoprotein LpoB